MGGTDRGCTWTSHAPVPVKLMSHQHAFVKLYTTSVNPPADGEGNVVRSFTSASQNLHRLSLAFRFPDAFTARSLCCTVSIRG